MPSKKKRFSQRLEELFEDLHTPSGAAWADNGQSMPPAWQIRCDAQGRLVAFDEGFAQAVGQTIEALHGRPLSSVFPSLDQHTLFAQLLTGEQDSLTLEVQLAQGQATLHLLRHIGDDDGHPVIVGLVQPQTPPAPAPPPMAKQPATAPLHGVVARGSQLLPAQAPLTPVGSQALATGQPVALPAHEGQPAALAAPLRLPQAVGLLEAIDPTPDRVWDEDEQRLVAEVAEQLALALENAQLFQAAQRRAAEMQALLTLSRTISRTLKLAEVYEATDEALQQLMPAESVLIGLITEDQEAIEVAYARDKEQRTPPGRRRLASEGLSRYVLQTGQPLLVQDFAAPADLPFRPQTNGASLQGPRSAVAAPLRVAERVIGLIAVQSYTPHAYTQADLNVLIGVADQVAIAIQNARLFEQTQNALTTTAELYQLTAAFNAASTYEEVLQALQEFLGEEVHTIIVGLFDRPWQEDEQPEWMYPAAYTSALELPAPTEPIRYRVSDFPQVKRIRDEQGLFIADAVHYEWSDIARQIYTEVLQARAVAFIPLVVGGRWIGFLNVLYRSPHAFTEEERRQIVAVTSQAAVAVENLRALEETQRQAQELAELNRLAQALSESLNLQEVYHTALEGVRDLFGIDAGLVSSAPSENPRALTLVASFGLPAEMQQEFQTHGIDVETTACGWTYKHTQPVIFEDLAQVQQPFAAMLQGYGFRTYLGIPIRYADKALGTLCLFGRDPYVVSEIDVQLLQTIGREIAVAAENARLFQQTQAALAETERLYRLSQALNSATSLAEVLEILRRHTSLGEHASNLSLNVYNRPWEDPNDIPEWSIVGARWTTLPPERLHPRYPLRQFQAAQMLRSEEPVIFTDVATDPRLDEATRRLYQEGFQAASTVFAPLAVGGRWIGYVNAIYGQRREFSPEEVRFLKNVMAQVAVTVQNLLLLEQSQRRAQAERVIREITAEIFQAPDLESTLQTAARLLTHAVGVSHAQVHLLPPQAQPTSPSPNPSQEDEQ